MQALDEYRKQVKEARREQRTKLIALIVARYPTLSQLVNKIDQSNHYTCSFFNSVVCELDKLQINRHLPLTHSIMTAPLLLLLIVVMCDCEHTDYWSPAFKQKLLDITAYLGNEPLVSLTYSMASYLLLSFAPDDTEKISPADLWTRFITYRFAAIRHIRENRSFFNLDKELVLSSHSTEANKSIPVIINQSDSLLGEHYHSVAEINTYDLIKFTGHHTGLARSKQHPLTFSLNPDDDTPSRKVEQATHTQLFDDGYMTANQTFTDKAYLDPESDTIYVSYYPLEIEGLAVKQLIPNIHNESLYIITPTKLYYIDHNSIGDNVDYQKLVCQETDIILTAASKFSIKPDKSISCLTPEQSSTFFSIFKHHRYDPEFLKVAKETTLKLAKKLYPNDNPVQLAMATHRPSQRMLNNSCFDVFVATSFDALLTTQLTQHMVSTLADDDIVALGAIGAERFTRLKELLTHTLEISLQKNRIKNQLQNKTDQIYAYTDDIQNPDFWNKICPQAEGKSLWVQTATQLYLVREVSLSTEKLAIELILDGKAGNPNRLIKALPILQKKFKESEGQKLIPIPYTRALLNILFFQLAEKIGAKLTDASGPNHLILHASVPTQANTTSGHTFYVLLEKTTDSIGIQIINGGSSEINYHEHKADQMDGKIRESFHYSRKPKQRFSLNNADDRLFLTHYIYSILALKHAPCASKQAYDTAIHAIYMTNNNPTNTPQQAFKGLGEFHRNVVTTREKSGFYFPRQWSGNCTVHNLVQAAICALGYPSGSEGGFHPVNDVFKRALDRLITTIRNMPDPGENNEAEGREETDRPPSIFDRKEGGGEKPDNTLSQTKVFHQST